MTTTDDAQNESPRDETDPPSEPGNPATRRLLAILAALVAARIGYELLLTGGLHQTAALYIGLPSIVAAIVIFFGAPKSSAGIAVKSVTIVLLMAMVVAGQLAVCVLMSAPIFYGAAMVYVLIRAGVERSGGGSGGRSAGLALIPLLALGVEGTPVGPTFERDESVRVVRIVDASPDAVRAALAQPLRLSRPLPDFLRLGFPRPVESHGGGLAPGDAWTTTFEIDGRRMDLRLVTRASTPTSATFDVVEDSTPISHWMALRGSEVKWRAVDGGRTEVEWTVHYERRLDPAWYFGPLQRHGARAAAGYLIDTAATP